MHLVGLVDRWVKDTPSELQINGQGFWLVLISFIIYSYKFNIIMKYIFQQVRSIYVVFCLFLYVLLNIFLHNMKKYYDKLDPLLLNQIQK